MNQITARPLESWQQAALFYTKVLQTQKPFDLRAWRWFRLVSRQYVAYRQKLFACRSFDEVATWLVDNCHAIAMSPRQMLLCGIHRDYRRGTVEWEWYHGIVISILQSVEFSGVTYCSQLETTDHYYSRGHGIKGDGWQGTITLHATADRSDPVDDLSFLDILLRDFGLYLEQTRQDTVGHFVVYRFVAFRHNFANLIHSRQEIAA